MNQAFTDLDFERLGDLLAAPNLPESTMNLEMLDGYLAALACMQPPPAPKEYLPLVFDVAGTPDIAWEDDAQQNAVLSLIAQRLAGLSQELSVPLAKAEAGALAQPFLFETDEFPEETYDAEGNREGEWLGRDWADGFAQAVEAWADVWQPLWEDEDHGMLLVPIMMLATGRDYGAKDFVFNPDELVGDAVLSVHALWHYFHQSH
ncbi:MAG: UPF0149 family protein [Burkholderiaceae bacterium]